MKNMESGMLSSGMASSSVAPPVNLIFDDCLEDDSCSICLEPYTAADPPSVTNCNHEYHLHCLLEWSQRRAECPICSQHLVLKDTVSQELLVGVKRERERTLRLSNSNRANQENVNNDDVSRLNGADLEHRIMRHIAAIASKARSLSRRRRQATQSVGPSQSHPSQPNVTRNQNRANWFVGFDSSTVCRSSSRLISGNPRRLTSSDFAAFSETLKAKISTASSRCKESITKSTHGLREKIIARNDSVKELSKEVQRELIAGIAGVSRMIERLDITHKRSAVSTHLSRCKCKMGNRNCAQEGKNP